MLHAPTYRLKKSLGQHFLKDSRVCEKIVETLGQHPFTRLLEVGPGAGALTRFLLNIENIDFKAVELDTEKVHYLLHQYPELQNRLIHADFLQIDPPFEEPFTLVGNFPYNISTEILFKVMGWRPQVENLVGMFQKEVAMRIAAPPGSKVYGVTSVLLQAWFNVEYLFDVPPESFNPPPKVMSGVIRLWPKMPAVSAIPPVGYSLADLEMALKQPPPPPFTSPAMKSEKMFTLLVKTAFNQRRKQLRNGVKSLFPEQLLQHPVFTRRAEQLSLADFANLSFFMHGSR